MLGPAQRIDIWLDLSQQSENSRIKLVHLPIPLDMMGGGMMRKEEWKGRKEKKTDKNIFLTGRAGTGKSTFVEYFRVSSKKRIQTL